MSETIQPLGQIIDLSQQANVATFVNHHVRQPEFGKVLRSRHLLGVLARHSGSTEESLHSIYRARKLHQDHELGVYVLNVAGMCVGMATVDPNPKLSRQKFNLPPRFAKSRLSSPVPTHGPEITAWINPFIYQDAEENLANAYKSLKDPNGIAKQFFDAYRLKQPNVVEPIQAWTIEPIDAPNWIHRAIKKGGFQHTGSTGLFDDGESRRHSPPPSKLYVARSPLA